MACGFEEPPLAALRESHAPVKGTVDLAGGYQPDGAAADDRVERLLGNARSLGECADVETALDHRLLEPVSGDPNQCCGAHRSIGSAATPVSYTHLTLPTNREV